MPTPDKVSSFSKQLRETASLFEWTADSDLDGMIEAVIGHIATALLSRLPVLVCGNGGSASDSAHITAELLGRFVVKRGGLKVIDLSAQTAFLTAWSNDFSFDGVFARQVQAYGEEGGVLWALSTSGGSPNVLAALREARAKRMATILLTGRGATSRLGDGLSDILIAVPSGSTPRIQEIHTCIYHYICERVEDIVAAS